MIMQPLKIKYSVPNCLVHVELGKSLNQTHVQTFEMRKKEIKKMEGESFESPECVLVDEINYVANTTNAITSSLKRKPTVA